MTEFDGIMKNRITVAEGCKILGERLRAARLEKNITQTELAKKIGVSRGNISEAEKGRSSVKTLIAIMIALNKEGGLDAMLPESYSPPIDVLVLNKRQRASGK